MDRDDRIREAAQHGREGELRDLLGQGAPVDASNERGETPLMLAVRGRHLGAARCLIDHGADACAEDRYGWTVMTYAACRPSPQYVLPPGIFAAGRADEFVALILAAGGTIDLREAVILGDLERVRELCDEGEDPDTEAGWIWHDTFLMVAADLGHGAIARFLLDRGVDIEGTDDLGHTALMRAAGAGHPEIVALLLDRGADIDCGWPHATALAEAAAKDQAGTFSLLMARGARRGYLDAATLGDAPLVAQLLRDDPDPFLRDRIVQAALGRGHIPVVRVLVEDEVARWATQPMLLESPLLVSAARAGDEEAVALLIELGADLHATSQYGKTPLAYAREHGHHAIADRLVRAGALR